MSLKSDVTELSSARRLEIRNVSRTRLATTPSRLSTVCEAVTEQVVVGDDCSSLNQSSYAFSSYR